MPKLIVQADDLAITHAATLGTVRAVKAGMVRTAGLFTNRPDAGYAADELAGIGRLDLGMDLNLVTGAPLLDAGQVPDLVGPDGNFRTSHQIKAAHRTVAQEGFYSTFEPEPFDHEQTLAEARAQVVRFFDLVGRPPAYLHHHSIISPMLDQVLHEVAAEANVPVMDDLMRFHRVNQVANTWYATPFTAEAQAYCDPIGGFLAQLDAIAEHEVSLLIVHPGYLDAELLDITSLHIVRARDLDLVTSPQVLAALADRGIELASYSSCGILG